MDRKVVLLEATYELLRKIENSPYSGILAETIYYDGTECDGGCLIDDIGVELGKEDD